MKRANNGMSIAGASARMVILAIMLVMCASPALADTHYWIDGSGNWSSWLNWDDNSWIPWPFVGPPRAGDTAVLNRSSSGSTTVTYDLNDTGKLASVDIDGTNGGTLVVQQTSASTALLTGTMTIGKIGAGGSFTQKAGTNTIDQLYLGLSGVTITRYSSTTGHWDYSRIPWRWVVDHYAGDVKNYAAYQGTGSYTLDGANASLSGTNAYIGYGGTGTFTHKQGAHTISGDMFVGSSVAFDVRNGSNNDGSLVAQVTNSGEGVYDQYGGSTTVKRLIIGDDQSSAGAFKLLGGSLSAETITNNKNGGFGYTGGLLNVDTFNNFGSFIGSGTINPYKGPSVAFNNSGTLFPRGPILPGYLLINGNYAQAPSGNIHIDILGPEQGVSYDFLDITGTASLDGILNIIFWNLLGFNLTSGTSYQFDVLHAAQGLTGTFDLTGNLPSGWIWTLSYVDTADADLLADTVRLTGSAVPIPGTLLMLGTGLIGLLCVRRCYAAATEG